MGGTWAYRAEAYNLSSEALTLVKWKAYKKTDGVNSNSGYYYVMVPLFTTDEAVCDRIEALAMQGRYTEACREAARHAGDGGGLLQGQGAAPSLV